MSAPPFNPDSRDLPYGWIQQYNWDYKQWFYVNTRENPPRSSWEHPLGPIPQSFAPPLAPPDRGFNRSPYGGPPPAPGYGGYQPNYGAQGYYPQPGPGGYGSYGPDNRGRYAPQEQVIYEDERRQRKKGPGMGTALLAGGAGLVGGALLMDAIEDHDEREREIGFDQGYQDGWEDNQANNWGDGGGFF